MEIAGIFAMERRIAEGSTVAETEGNAAMTARPAMPAEISLLGPINASVLLGDLVNGRQHIACDAG